MIKKLFFTLVALTFLVALILPIIQQDKYVSKVEPVVDIEVVKKPLPEQPLHNVDLPDFAAFSNVAEKKTAFFNFLKPVVEQENQRLLLTRAKLSQYHGLLSKEQPLNQEAQSLIVLLSKKYKIDKKLRGIDKLNALLARVDIIPTELVLVQAANESAWGTSRFAKIGLNFFGIWCYKKNCGMVPNGRDSGLRHEVQAFQSVESSVSRYLHNINTNSAYHVLREIRKQLREQNLAISPQMLATGLLPYSERGSDYILEISDMIRHNHRYFVK